MPPRATSPHDEPMVLRGGICLGLALLVLMQVREALPVYVLWLAVAGLCVWYHGRFALMPVLHRPERDGTIVNVLFAMDLLAHVAVAAVCRVGWFGVVLLVFTYFCFARFAGHLASRRAAADILRIVAENEPDITPEEQAQLAQVMLEQRQQAFREGRSMN